MNLFDLTGKRALVTGGRNGNLGPIWVDILRRHGAIVHILDKPEYDVSNKVDVARFKFIMAGIPDIIVNSAAIDNSPDTTASFFGQFDEIMRVNIGGAVNVVEAFIGDMKTNGKGVIVNIGSIQGYGGADHRNYEGSFEKPFGYNASKWGLRGLAKSITTQYGRYGIRSVTISFGPYDGGKLSTTFLDKFLRNVPLCSTISKESLQMTLLYACCCTELAGVDWRVDAGLGAWA
jgi:2-keto-3-deoxy-L-fuconate dehydrogenase